MSKSKSKLFYKVFVTDSGNGHYKSTQLEDDIHYPIGIDYSTIPANDGYITAPGNTRFFLFSTIEDAKYFISNESWYTPSIGIIKAVKVKGGYATGCKGIKSRKYFPSNRELYKIRKYFWDKVDKLTKNGNMSMAKASMYAVTSAPDDMQCVNTPYKSVFAKHIKILPDIIK